MASPVGEQSDEAQYSTLAEESDTHEIGQKLQNISGQDMTTDSDQGLDMLHHFDESQSSTSEFHHHAVKEGAPSVGSAFHVVSHPDDQKDRIIIDQSNSKLDEDGHLETTSGNCGGTSRSANGQHRDDSVHVGTLFSAHIVEQHSSLPENIGSNLVNESQHLQTLAVHVEDEDMLLGISDDKTAVEGMNINDPDADEKALLDEVENFNKESEDLQELSQPKLVTDFQFLKPSIHDNIAKDSSVVGSSVDNDVESELRKEHPFHKPEAVFNIDEETRMGLDQTPIDSVMIDSSFIYPTLPPKKLFHLDDTKDSEASDTETKMSGICETEDIRLRNTISIDDATKDSAASDSNAETPTPSRKQRRASRDGLGISMMEGLEAGERVFTADNLFEYQWPQDGGEWHLLQEQISEYLKVKSFKRKYPDLYRRTCDKEEKDFLRDKGVVTETQSDLGLTALRSDEVYDLMMKDYNNKYKEYISHLQEKQKKVIREKHKEYSSQAKLDKSKIETYSKKAVRSAAEFNASLMRDKKEERRAYFDLQTYTIHFPKSKFRTLPAQCTKVGAYPVALIPGQFQENYKKYSAEELMYFPLRTSLKDPPKVVKYVRNPPPGAKLPISDKQKTIANSDGEESNGSNKDDNEDNVEHTDKGENEFKENDNTQVESIEMTSPFKLEKKIKVGMKRKYIKSSPDRMKKTGKRSKEVELDKSEEKISQEGEEKGTSPESKKMPAKIHGLEKCRICKKRSTKEERKAGKLVKCAECGKIGHMGCLDLTEELVAVIKTYPWQCMECKTCVECLDPYDEDKMMFCDRCDRGYHTFCIGLQALPTGHWECKSCEGSLRLLERPKPNLTEGNLPERLKRVHQIITGSSPKVKDEPDVIGIAESGDIKSEDIKTPTVTLDEPELVSLECEEKEASSSEKDEPTSSKTSTPRKVSHKRGKNRMIRKTKGKPTPKIKSAKEDRITGARQSRRLRIKVEVEEERRKKDDGKMLKRKKKNSKSAEEETEASSVIKDEAMEEGGNSDLKTGGGVVSDRTILDSNKEMVSEGVDDSFNMFDKNDSEDNNMEVTQTVVGEEISKTDVILTGNVEQKVHVDTVTENMEEMSTTQGGTDLPVNKIQEMHLTAENCPESEIKSYDEKKTEPECNLKFPDSVGASRSQTSSQATSASVDSEQETLVPGVHSSLQEAEYNSSSSSQQAVQFETLTTTDPIPCAPSENLQSQTHLQALPQSTSSILPMEDVTKLQILPSSIVPPLEHLEEAQPGIQLSESIPVQDLHVELQRIDSQISKADLEVTQQSTASQPESTLTQSPFIPVTNTVSRDQLLQQDGQPLLDPIQSNTERIEALNTVHPATDLPAEESSVECKTDKDIDDGLTNRPENTGDVSSIDPPLGDEGAV